METTMKLPMDMGNYNVTVECGNCGYISTLTVPKGCRVKEKLCSNCNVVGELRAYRFTRMPYIGGSKTINETTFNDGSSSGRCSTCESCYDTQ